MPPLLRMMEPVTGIAKLDVSEAAVWNCPRSGDSGACAAGSGGGNGVDADGGTGVTEP